MAAAALYASAGDLRRAAAAEGNLADAYNRIGEYDAAEAALTKAYDGCRRVGNRIYEGYVLANLGYAYARRARTDEALSALATAEALASEANDRRLAASVHLSRALALSSTGRFEEALTAAQQAAQVAHEVSLGATEAAAEALTARLVLALGSVEDALEWSRRALARCDELGGGVEDEADIYVARIDALRAAGRLDEAAQVRLRGAARLRAIAAGITDPVWRLRFERNVAAHRYLLEGETICSNEAID